MPFLFYHTFIVSIEISHQFLCYMMENGYFCTEIQKEDVKQRYRTTV